MVPIAANLLAAAGMLGGDGGFLGSRTAREDGGEELLYATSSGACRDAGRSAWRRPLLWGDEGQAAVKFSRYSNYPCGGCMTSDSDADQRQPYVALSCALMVQSPAGPGWIRDLLRGRVRHGRNVVTGSAPSDAHRVTSRARPRPGTRADLRLGAFRAVDVPRSFPEPCWHLRNVRPTCINAGGRYWV